MNDADDDLIGMRLEDLSTDERARQAALLERSPDARRAHRAAMALGEAIRDLPELDGPTAEEARARLHVAPKPANRSFAAYAAMVSVAAASVAAFLGFQSLAGLSSDPTASESMRDRGLVGASVGVHLEAVAESARGLRPLGPRAEVAPDERVVFHARTNGAGELTLDEIGATEVRIWPSVGQSWSVQAGAHVPGGGALTSYRPDQPGDVLRYRATLCPPAGGGCATDELSLRWAR